MSGPPPGPGGSGDRNVGSNPVGGGPNQVGGPNPDGPRPGEARAGGRSWAFGGALTTGHGPYGGHRGHRPDRRTRYEMRMQYREERKHNRVRPGWWPEGEPWPPQGEFPWRRIRRVFFIRFAIGVTLFLALLAAGPIIVIGQLLGLAGVSGPASILGSIGLFLFIVLIVAGTARGARRFALPVGALIEAAGRVEAGDYSARVSEYYHGPRELRAMIAAFNSMAARLEDDEQQRRTLLADVSHELRTPLAVLQGELEAMIDGVHPTDQAHLEVAVDEIRMLTGLVEDLRTLTLAEAGTLALHREPTDLAVLAQDVAEGFASLAATEQVRIKVDLPGDLPLADIDPLRIRQVLSNLIANALRYAPEDSEVTVSVATAAAMPNGENAAQPQPPRVVFEVADRGPGISPDVLPHLFDRFAKSPESRGSGLGLAIARRLVEAHGGTIAAEQPAQGGTTIRFELPVGGA